MADNKNTQYFKVNNETDIAVKVLSSLSVDEKLDLIAKLTNSIRNTYTKEQDIETEDPFACYEGDWGGNMSAEE